MCGIAGIIGFTGGTIDPAALDQMTDALAHRGPDGRGTIIDGPVGFGHRRLSILDLTTAGSQPMQSDDGSVTLTFNGEIYNFVEERERLEAKGYCFHSRSDTEVLLKLYEEYGPDCLSHLRGMFAFAVLDKKRNIVFLARDRFGKKPLYYFHEAGVFAFASETKALRTLPQCPTDVDFEALHHFLTMMYLPSPRTGFTGLHKLPASHSLTINLATGEKTIERYWQLSFETDDRTPLPEWKERITVTLEESVRLRMVADVPVGAFLSGGLDSATIVALMSRMSSHPVKTFTIGSRDTAFNELPQADMVAKAFGTDHHPIVLEPDIVHLLPELVQAYEEPYADPSLIPTYLVARETHKHVTVALNGDGGDENFGGYVRYPIMLFSEKWRRMPGFLHALTRAGTHLQHLIRNDTFSYRCKRFEDTINLPFEKRFLQYLSFFTDSEKRALYARDFGTGFMATDEWYAELTRDARSRAIDPLHRVMSMDIDTYLPDDLMPKVDRGTMAHGLEARSPFLDHTLLELTARLPAAYQVRGRTTKWIMREVVKDWLPAEILEKKKTGFRLPLNRWFRNDLKDFVDNKILEGSDVFWQMFDRSKVEVFLQQYRDSNVDYSDHVWALLWLSEWTRQYT
ncbi:MAG TPA: asparagine synthase (glutamine-hydrolyzing) [Candidatus Peribacteraceae bacterium]|nr:asparagine synthase (glutamine-hydrolyzing) [Candidatus Peribacteraceae bacterium]